jgi:20S proteasome subunit alpha 3
VGVLASDGVILIAEKRVGSALLDVRSATEKLFRVDSHIACAVAGITSDANTLIEHARVNAQRHLYAYQDQAPVETIVENLCSLKQSYTQFGGLRPFGVAFLMAGWDRHRGFQLYQTDPSGNYSGWAVRAIGSNHAEAHSLLKEKVKEDAPLPDRAGALELAVRLIGKAMGSTLEANKVEVAALSREGDEVVFRVLSEAELKPVLEKAAAEAEEERSKEAGGDK